MAEVESKKVDDHHHEIIPPAVTTAVAAFFLEVVKFWEISLENITCHHYQRSMWVLPFWSLGLTPSVTVSVWDFLYP